MKRFTDALQQCVDAENWYTAIPLALALPDICSSLETLDAKDRRKVGRRYTKWYRTWLEPKYTFRMPDGPHVFLSAEDCYALRCSALHQGSDDITEQDARRALESFDFVAPKAGWMIHLNQTGQRLQLQADIFCNDFIHAVCSWDASVVDDAAIQLEKKSLLSIRVLGNKFAI